MKRARATEVDVEGRPELVLRDEDLEAVAELVAEALIAAIERERAEERSP